MPYNTITIMSRASTKSEDPTSKRTVCLFLAIFAVFIILLVRLFFLQIINQERYKLLSDKNRIHTSFSAAPRGIIYDRNNRVIASYIYKYQAAINLNIYKKNKDNWRQIKRTLSLEKGIKLENIIKKALKHSGPCRSVVIKEDLDWEDVLKTEVLSSSIPGLFVSKKFVRCYPHSDAFCHVIGYVTQPHVKDIEKDKSLNILGATVGRAGVEGAKDLLLRGEIGMQQHEINAYRRFVRIIEKRKPKQGLNIQTTLHLELQAETAKIMATNVRQGAAIVLNTETGDILSMVSVPTFEPNLFTQKMTAEQWNAINKNADNPLMNRAISGLYAPGSTFKMVIALAALKAKVIDKNTKFFCSGYHNIRGRCFHCWRWRLGGHGAMDVVQAIAQSCDVFFYNIAEKLDPAQIIEAAKELGIRVEAGLLPNEKPAGLPVLVKKGKLWLGQALNLSIGQGNLLTSPLHLLAMTASIASGKAVVPRIISSSKKPDFCPLSFSKEHLDVIRMGLKMVVSEARGTARRIDNKELKIAGKTGSTQVSSISREERRSGRIKTRPYHLKDHAFFVGYAPADAPRFAVVVIVEHGESGGRVAAPIAKEILLAANRLIPENNADQ
ncbi:MAG: penicillin-binding protein 2 [Holosporales bacterium]|jgi:penicillin-binding protein 2|nr:penicillin-binding protein 2 [Holosporales bacterium]